MHKKQFYKLIQVLATSYHNTGAQFEYLNDPQNTLKYYIQAFAYANKFLGKDDPLTYLCQQSWTDAKKKIE